MDPSRSSVTAPARRRLLKRALLIASLLLMVVSVFVDLHEVGRDIPSRWSDFYSPWYGSKSALHGTDPYSREVTRDIQLWFYGHTLDPSHPGNDVQAFVYPAIAIPVFAAATLIPWDTLRILFFLLTPPLVFMSSWYWASRTGVARSRGHQWLVALIATASVPSFWGIQVMQPTVLIFVGITAVIAMLCADRYTAAGALLALTTVKPNLVLILTAWLLVLMIVRCRWRFVAGFGAVLTALLILSQALVPDWPRMWYNAAVSYAHLKPSIIEFLFGRYASIALLVSTAVLIAALYKLGAPDQRSRRFVAAISLILSLTVCVIPNGPWMVYNQILLIPPVLYLASTRAIFSAYHVMRMVAIGFTWFTVASVPISVVAILIHENTSWAVELPYTILLLPISVLVAAYLACRDLAIAEDGRVAADPTGSPAPGSLG